MGISPSHLERLREDLVLGARAGISYRKSPKPTVVEGKLRARSYYDSEHPKRKPVTEHYYLRVYKKFLKEGGTLNDTAYEPQEAIVQRINKASRSPVKTRRDVESRIWPAYVIRQQALGTPVTEDNWDANVEKFETLMNDLRIAQLDARNIKVPPASESTKKAAYATGSIYSNALVQLGLRLGNETWSIGDSPEHAGNGGYYAEVVQPAMKDSAVNITDVEANDPEREAVLHDYEAEGIEPDLNLTTRQLKSILRVTLRGRGKR